MARREKKPISTMMGLLRAMVCESGSRKTGAILRRHRMIYVEEYFDDGKGHSGAFTSDCTDVVPELFEQAQRERFISGKLELGYVSDWEFKITSYGQEEYWRRKEAADHVLKFLSSGEAWRLDDMYRALSRIDSYPLEVVRDVMDWLISEEYLDSHEHVGQKFYLLGLRRKIA